jgi:hypothetical protein
MKKKDGKTRGVLAWILSNRLQVMLGYPVRASGFTKSKFCWRSAEARFSNVRVAG